jgi:hypothetical protein
MFLIAAAAGAAIAIGLLHLSNIARRAAIIVAIAGMVLLIPKVSDQTGEFSVRFFQAAASITVRVMIVWYLWQSWTAERFTKRWWENRLTEDGFRSSVRPICARDIAWVVRSLRQVRTLICPKCDATVADNSQFCSNCGNLLTPAQFAASTVAPSTSVASQTSGKAMASLVCGILNVFPLFIVAIILGHMWRSEIRKSAGRLKGDGIALARLILGYMGVVAIPLILIVAAIAIPNLLRAKMFAELAHLSAAGPGM